MLRRRPDSTLEFVLLELTLDAAAPGALSVERKEALRLRIMESIGEQLPAPRRVSAAFASASFKSRWVVVPAGAAVGIVVLATLRSLDANDGAGTTALSSRITGAVVVDGQLSDE